MVTHFMFSVSALISHEMLLLFYMMMMIVQLKDQKVKLNQDGSKSPIK